MAKTTTKKTATKKTPTKKTATKKAAPKKTAAVKSKEAAPKKKAAKKKAVAEKATSDKKTTPNEKTTPEKKTGLRKPQERIIQALAKGPMTRGKIAVEANCDYYSCTEYLGAVDPDTRQTNDQKHFPSLIGLGLVKIEQHDLNGKDTLMYQLTKKGQSKLK